MYPIDYISDVDLSYDKTKLLDEMDNVTFAPMNFTRAGRGTSGIEKPPHNSWFHNPPTWLQGHVLDEYPEINRVQTQICNLLECRDIRPRYYKQEKNTEVPMHNDRGTFCAINIMLSDNAAPIIFKYLGEIKYECALLNIRKHHAVPSFPEERVLLKFSIFDVSYKDALSNYRINTLKEKN